MNAKKEFLDNISERTLKNYSNFFEKKKLSLLMIEENGTLIELRKNIKKTVASIHTTAELVNVASTTDSNSQAVAKPDGKYITSPLIGTFYPSPNPDAPPYVKVGDVVKNDTKVCIIEAMKVMNEIPANLSGTIVEILVKDKEVVQVDQPIMLIK